MSSQELEQRKSGGEMEQQDGEQEERGENGGDEGRPALLPVGLRGAAIGAAGGAAVGAALAIARALRPEEADAVQEQLVGAGRAVGTAAVRAAGGVLTAKPVSDLIAGNKDSDRSETVKQAAKEAGVAAASAARDAIASMRDDQNGS